MAGLQKMKMFGVVLDGLMPPCLRPPHRSCMSLRMITSPGLRSKSEAVITEMTHSSSMSDVDVVEWYQKISQRSCRGRRRFYWDGSPSRPASCAHLEGRGIASLG